MFFKNKILKLVNICETKNAFKNIKRDFNTSNLISSQDQCFKHLETSKLICTAKLAG